MATGAKLGKLTQFKLGDGGSPETFTLVPEVTGTLQIGEESPEVDATSFDSTAVERIADLPDGTMIDIEMQYSGHAQQDALITAVKAQANRNFQVYNPSFVKTYAFTLAPLAWTMKFVPKGEAVKLMFKGRISGSVTIS